MYSTLAIVFRLKHRSKERKRDRLKKKESATASDASVQCRCTSSSSLFVQYAASWYHEDVRGRNWRTCTISHLADRRSRPYIVHVRFVHYFTWQQRAVAFSLRCHGPWMDPETACNADAAQSFVRSFTPLFFSIPFVSLLCNGLYMVT